MQIKNKDMVSITYMLKRISNLDSCKGYSAEGIELSPTEYAGDLADEILKLIDKNSTVQIPETPQRTVDWDSDVARRNFNDVFNLAQPLIDFDVKNTRKILCFSPKALAQHTENELYQRFSELLYSCFQDYSIRDTLPLDLIYTTHAENLIARLGKEAQLMNNNSQNEN